MDDTRKIYIEPDKNGKLFLKIFGVRYEIVVKDKKKENTEDKNI